MCAKFEINLQFGNLQIGKICLVTLYTRSKHCSRYGIQYLPKIWFNCENNAVDIPWKKIPKFFFRSEFWHIIWGAKWKRILGKIFLWAVRAGDTRSTAATTCRVSSSVNRSGANWGASIELTGIRQPNFVRQIKMYASRSLHMDSIY